MKYGMLLTVLLYEVVLIGGIAWWLARKEKGQKHKEGDFALGGRSLPVSVVAVTMALTVLGTAHILGVFEMTWYMGAAAVWFSLGHVILLVVVCLSTGLWVRRMGVTTVPEILEMFFGPGVRILVSCVMAGVIFGILTLETQGIGIIISSMSGWGITQGAMVGGVLGVLYVVLAGIKEIGWVNVVNAIIMYTGVVLATVYIAFNLPGASYDGVADYYTRQDQDFMLSIWGNSEIFLTFVLGTVIAVVFSSSISQMLLQTAMSAKSEGTVRKALWIAAPVNGLFGVFAVILALTAKSIPEFHALGPKQAATTMLVEMLPPWLSSLLLASFLGAILSTFAMTCLTPATIFSNDIYKRFFKPKATEAELTRITRIVIIALALVAIGVASYLPPILAAVSWLLAWLIPVFWVVMFGFFWKRSWLAAQINLVISWVANSVWSFTSLPAYLGMEGMPNSYITLGCTLFVGVICNLIFTGERGYFRSNEYLEKISLLKKSDYSDKKAQA